MFSLNFIDLFLNGSTLRSARTSPGRVQHGLYELTSPNNHNTSRISSTASSDRRIGHGSTTADTLIHSGAKELPRFWDKRGLWPIRKSGTADNSPASLMAFAITKFPPIPAVNMSINFCPSHRNGSAV